MKAPLDAVLLILSWEQLRLTRYRDGVGKWTIGWGHLMHDGDAHEITRETANRLFLADLARTEAAVRRALGNIHLEDQQFGTLVSFTFNVGADNLAASTLLQLIKDGELEGVPDQLRRWVYGTDRSGRKVKLAGLVERRESEARLWIG